MIERRRLGPGRMKLGQRRLPLPSNFCRLSQCRIKPPARVQVRLLLTRTLQVTRQTVVVLVADRIELVIVTSRTRHGHAKERLTHHIDLVIDPVRLVLTDIGRRMRLLVQEPPARRLDRFVDFRFGVDAWLDKVASDVFFHKPIKRHIVVQRADDIVAVLPCVRDVVIKLVAIALGITHQVKPVPAPLLSIPRRRQQPIHQPLIGLRRLVFHKRIHLRRRRGQPR